MKLERRQNRVFAGACGVLLVVATMLAVAAPTGADTTDGGWSIVDPGSVGLDASTLTGARTYAFEPGRNTQGVVIARAGKIADEWYAPGEGPSSWSASWSMAKSVAGILIGIAIDEGKIANVNQSMSTWFPSWAGTPKAAVTLKDVLTMSSGLQSDENYDPAHAATSDVIQMGLSADELAYAKDRPLVATPGTVFNYSSADAMLLSGVIEAATGMSAGDYAKAKLFDPLGIEQAEWWTDAAGHTLTYCCLDTTTRNFARIGLLYLNDGNWNGHQVVSASWVHDSLTPTTVSGGNYGYLFWFAHIPGISEAIPTMNGFDGQYVYMIPSLDLVVARNGDYTKSSCPAVADPNLFSLYPPRGLSPTAGTRPPSSWSAQDFLKPVVDAVTGPPGPATYPDAESKPATRDPDGQAMAPCAADETPDSTSTTVPAEQPATTQPAPSAATPVSKVPTFTG